MKYIIQVQYFDSIHYASFTHKKIVYRLTNLQEECHSQGVQRETSHSTDLHFSNMLLWIERTYLFEYYVSLHGKNRILHAKVLLIWPRQLLKRQTYIMNLSTVTSIFRHFQVSTNVKATHNKYLTKCYPLRLSEIILWW